jgi:hypothetical protein
MLPNWINPSAPISLRQNKSRREYKADNLKQTQFHKLLQEQINQAIIFQVHHNFVAHYNPSFLVPKGIDWRMVLDCQILNMLLRIIHFKMEGPENLIQLAQENDFATSLDIKSAFNHIPVHPSFQPFLCFSFQNNAYAYRAMPFGVKDAPRLFTKALSYPIAFIRLNWSVRILAYMDDIIIPHQDPQYLAVATPQIAIYLQSLGWTINVKKSELTPSQEIDFLGWN